MKTVRILVADDHALVRRAVRSLLEGRRGWKVVAEASSGPEAIAKAKRLRPDVVVMDITMGDSSGLDAARAIAATCPGSRVVILTMHESQQAIREALSAGAQAYVSKSDAERDVVAAVRAVVERRPFFTRQAAEVMLDSARNGGASAPPEAGGRTLSARQLEVVRLLVEGKSNKEIAAALRISVRTAEAHRANIMRRLGVSSLSGVVRYALRSGIVKD